MTQHTNYHPNTLFWNVDTQNDFMNKDGKLPVEDADKIKQNLASLTELAKQYDAQVVNTGDWHEKSDEELSDTPDFVHTYSEHCLANTKGAEFIPETNPANAYVVPTDGEKVNLHSVKDTRNIVLYKTKFDVFAGNEQTDTVLEQLAQEKVIVYGVATNVCVDQAVKGLVGRGKEVYVVEDAIKHLPHLDQMDHPLYKGLEGTLADWKDQGVELITTDEVSEYLQN